MRTWLMVGFGGFLGSICRYGVTLLPLQHSSGFPFATLIVNIIGALLIGMLTGLANQITGIHADWFTFLQTGFCGGFTTFPRSRWKRPLCLAPEKAGMELSM